MKKIHAVLYTSDPYEPSGVIGLYETEEQREKIITEYNEAMKKQYPALNFTWEDDLSFVEIPIGVYGQYW